MNISYQDLQVKLAEILVKESFSLKKAELIARIFASASLDGYHSHGVNRFVEFVKNVRNGTIDPQQDPVIKQSLGVIEQWDGKLGAGPSNAYFAMDRAISLAKTNHLGCVGLANTNHWMRGGTYGWQAAEAGCIGICFTNTMPNMAPWGGLSHTTGNNPLIIAVPQSNGQHIVLDMSLSQFSYGQLYKHQLEGNELPLPGGYDAKGELTTDPGKILNTRRLLPTGYWKGSGLSLILDLVASLVAQGRSTAQVASLERETALSQFFLCINQKALGEEDGIQATINEILSFFTASSPAFDGAKIRYPGQETFRRRKRQLAEGIEINPTIWKGVVALVDY